jgi:sugar lactone lactonase YvrE
MRNDSQFPIFLAAWLTMASAIAGAQTNFGSVNIGSNAASAATLTIQNAATLGSISVVTQGATGQDFTNAGAGTCTAGASYTAGQTCTVKVTFKPAFAGARYGVVQLVDGSGNLIATSYLAGIGTGPQIMYGPGTVIAINPTVNGSGLIQPSGVAVDGMGNLYIADDLNKRVVEVPAGGGAAIAIDPTVTGEGFGDPRGTAVDGAGDLFTSDLQYNRVVEIPAGGGAPFAIDPTVNGVGLDYPCGMVIDGAGNLYIANVDKSLVVEVPAGGGAAIAIDPKINGVGLSYPVTLALDSAGDLFIADEMANHVIEVPDVAEYPSGPAPVVIAPTVNGQSLYQPYGVAVDAAGDLFIADSGNNRLIEVPAGGGAATVINTTVNGKGLSLPVNITLDNGGDLFIADSGNNRVVEVERSQPPALNFAATAVGSTSSDSPQTVQVENSGNAALNFPAPGSGNNPSISASFTLGSGGASDCPLVASGSSSPGTLAAGATCDLPISFQPASTGSIYGALTLTDNNLGAAAPGYATQIISLSGNAPVASLSATGVAFGIQDVGTSSAPQQVTLTNTGSAALAITSISVTGAEAASFVFPNPCGSSLAMGANCIIQGHFTPASAAALTAVIAITDSAGGSPQIVTLTGTGVYAPTVTVTPSSPSITSAQALTATVAVSGGGGNPTPTGQVTLTSGSYSSAPTVLSGGSASISISAGSLAVGTDSLVAAYTPDNASSSIYNSASGSNSVVVTGMLAPVVTTVVVSAATDNSATLAGTVNPNGADTQYWFLYGVSSTLSGATQTPSQDAGSTPGVDAISAGVTGLSADTTYYYQAVAKNSAGTTSGAIVSFTTIPAPYFSINGTSVTVTAGAATANTSTITATPWYGFTGSVSLSCAITPQAASDPATCSLPTAVTISGTAAKTATLTVSTTAATTALNERLKLYWTPAGGSALACILLFGVPARRRRWRAVLGLLALLIVLSCGMASCGGAVSGGGGGGGGGNAGTTKGIYAITVTGTSGSMTETGPAISLTVQ